MAHYAVGDIHGCFDELMLLLEQIQFNHAIDQLWLTGDLINRGPKSLEVLRFLYALTPAPIIVLGNHDLHLLAVWAGASILKPQDTFNDILQAADCDELCHWLRHQKIAYYEPTLNFLLVHAGLAPHWDLTTTLTLAREIETALSSPNYRNLLCQMYGDIQTLPRDDVENWARLSSLIDYFTRVRFCTREGRLDLKLKSHSSPALEEKLVPWFKIRHRQHKEVNILFGHWAALQGKTDEPNIFPLDTGCIWGGTLTALRLEDKHFFRVKSSQTPVTLDPTS